jgi:hypothetical protein
LRLFFLKLFFLSVESREAGNEECLAVLETLLVVFEEFAVSLDALQELSVALLV